MVAIALAASWVVIACLVVALVVYQRRLNDLVFRMYTVVDDIRAYGDQLPARSAAHLISMHLIRAGCSK